MYKFSSSIFCFSSLAYIFSTLPLVLCTWRYYNNIAYGSGDSIMTAFHNHGGPKTAYAKWVMECADGEALNGVIDYQNNFERFESFACKFFFPNKPPAMRYPYYSSCNVRNFTAQQFCFDPQDAERTIHTFITGIWDDDQQFVVLGRLGLDNTQLYKCCKVPNGYYIDYVSCYYMPTHDPYFEFYDATQQIFVQCGTGYTMTGLAKKLNPWTQLFNVDWIQCCRVGYGPPTAVSPPIVYSSSGTPTFFAREALEPALVTREYQEQYRAARIARNDCSDSEFKPATPPNNSSPPIASFCSTRYQRPVIRRTMKEEEPVDHTHQWNSNQNSLFQDFS